MSHVGCTACPWLVPQASGLLRRWLCSSKRHPSDPPTIFLFLQSFGFSLLARSSYHWQLSFSRAEQVLLEQLDEDGGCRRKCLQALRQMKEDVWCPGKRPVLVSYHLQVSVWPGELRVGGSPRRPVGPGRGHSEGACVCVMSSRWDASVHICHPTDSHSWREINQAVCVSTTPLAR